MAVKKHERFLEITDTIFPISCCLKDIEMYIRSLLSFFFLYVSFRFICHSLKASNSARLYSVEGREDFYLKKAVLFYIQPKLQLACTVHKLELFSSLSTPHYSISFS